MILGGLRLAIWFLAVLFAALPVIVSVAPTPSHASDLVRFSAYAGVARDMLFLAVAILAIGLIDAFEILAVTLWSGRGTNQALLSFAMVMVIIPQLLIYAEWCAPDVQLGSLDGAQAPAYVMSAVACALVTRLTLLFGGA